MRIKIKSLRFFQIAGVDYFNMIGQTLAWLFN